MVTGSDARHAAVAGRLGNGTGDRRADPGIKGGRQDVFVGQLVRGDQVRQGAGCRVQLPEDFKAL